MNYLANLVPVDPFEEIKQEFRDRVSGRRGCNYLLRYLDYQPLSRNDQYIFHDMYERIQLLNEYVQEMNIQEYSVNLVISFVRELANKSNELKRLNTLIQQEYGQEETNRSPQLNFFTIVFGMLKDLLDGMKTIIRDPASISEIDRVLGILHAGLFPGRGGSRGISRGGRRKSRKSRKSRRHR